MTPDEVAKIRVKWKRLYATATERINEYCTEDGRIGIIDHVPCKIGIPCGEPFRHYTIDGEVYETKEAFIAALADFK